MKKDEQNPNEREGGFRFTPSQIALFEMVQAALRVTVAESSSISEQAYASRKLAEYMHELTLEFGAETAGQIFSVFLEEEEKRHPERVVQNSEAEVLELRTILEEVDRQVRGLN